MVAGVPIVINLTIGASLVFGNSYHLDLDVYRIGAQTWLTGGELYGDMPPTAIGMVLPFTYPPIAAVVFAPATLVSLPVAGALLTALTIGLLLVVIELVLRSVGPDRPHWVLAG